MKSGVELSHFSQKSSVIFWLVGNHATLLKSAGSILVLHPTLSQTSFDTPLLVRAEFGYNSIGWIWNYPDGRTSVCLSQRF